MSDDTPHAVPALPLPIVVRSMLEGRHVTNRADDWTGVTSTSERRRLQNRLNQRSHRRRQRDTTALARLGNSASDSGPAHGAHRHDNVCDSFTNAPSATLCNGAARCHVCQNAQAHESYPHTAPFPAHLQTVIQYNVSVSPFILAGPDIHTGYDGERCPASLKPTELQLQLHHHPWIDLLPLPQLRDNILSACRYPDTFDEDALCWDMAEMNMDVSSDKPCLVVWGQPWDPKGWEVTVPFLRKWGFLLVNCHDLFDSTNYWRAKRGLRKLRFS
ncbi:hypothetical protein GGR57DRAFT_517239 [Xylariaceae sp. FL1272]|nr:hypothetical protein GGR57DRAFT_517239 [Xylariaceae sp. FL1272]